MPEHLVISHADLSAIEQALGALQDVAADVGGQVDALEQRHVQLSDRLEWLIQAFSEFVRGDARHKEVQLAETRLVRVRQELETKFGHYAEVRRRATGILQAFEQKLVSHATVQHTTEEMMMKAPGYWLAPALVALATWARDDRLLADRALAEALRRDDYKTSLFFALVTRRLGRQDATAQWFNRYLAQQNATALDREFVILLDAIANGLFGPGLLKNTVDTIDGWLADLASRANFVSDQEARWSQALDALTPNLGENEFTTLRRFSTNWDAVEKSVASARRNQQVEHFFCKIFEGPLAASPRLEKDVDTILDSLVTNFDEDELPIRSQERMLQLIIEQNGDKDAAQKLFDSEKRNFDDKASFVELLTNAAMHPELSKASLGTRRLAVALSRPWIVAAHDQLATKSRASLPRQVDLKIGDWTGAVVDGSNETDLLSKLSTHFDVVERKAFDEIRQPVLAYIGVGASLLIAAWGVINATPFIPFVIFAAAGMYAALAIRDRRLRAATAKQQVAEQRENASKILRAALAETVDLLAERAREDGKAEDTRATLLAISPQQVTLTRPSAARAVIG